MSVPDPLSQFPAALVNDFNAALAAARLNANVAGVDIGRDSTGQLAVRTHLRSEIQMQPNLVAANSNGALPGSTVVEVVGIYKMEVEPRLSERPPVSALAPQVAIPPAGRLSMQLPLRPGISVTGDGMEIGTLGTIVFDASGRAYILSCAHVLGTEPSAQIATEQPFNTMLKRRVGLLANAVNGTNGDAAISQILVDAQPPITYCLRTYSELPGHSAIIGAATMATLDAPVSKSGKTTHVTSGAIDGIGHYFLGAGASDGYRGFRISRPGGGADPLSDYGDSGAVWYNSETSAGVGVHVAGTGTYSIACHLATVLDIMGVYIGAPAGALNLVNCVT